MPKMVIEVPEEFAEVGKAMAEHLAALQRTVSRLGGGKAVDYAEIEQAMSESAGRTELAGHRAILQSLDASGAGFQLSLDEAYVIPDLKRGSHLQFVLSNGQPGGAIRVQSRERFAQGSFYHVAAAYDRNISGDLQTRFKNRPHGAHGADRDQREVPVASQQQLGLV